MVLPRLMTGIVGIALFLGGIYFGGLPFFFLVLAVVLVGLREFYLMARQTGYPCYAGVGLLASAVWVFSVFLNGVSAGPLADNQSTSAILALILLWIVLRSVVRGPADTSLSEWSVTCLGIFYVAWTLSHLLLLRELRPGGRELTFGLFVIIWVADTFAYAVGSRWGHHKIAPAISPKKSWEGTLAGLGGAAGASVVLQQTLLKAYCNPAEALGIGIAVGLVSFVSDLGESILKRGAGLKDSSPLLPGHGGVLDRFDSFFLTAPLYYYFWVLIKR
jgi:phosphatidate cytidylyltransferase